MISKSFFEYLGIADVERIHSQFLAWVLFDCNAINTKQKNKLLKDIFKLKNENKIEKIQTERKGIDILIQTDKGVIVVENKIKSSQHSSQLKKYKEFCEAEFHKGERNYYFLTLIGEHTDDKDWNRISYSHIYEHLKSLTLKPNNNHSVIIKEYLIYLNKLVSVVEDFKKNYQSYEMVFTDGKKKKEAKIGFKYDNDNHEFIASNQLETILQKCFLSSLVEKIKSPIGIISDTLGVAYVDFPLERNIIHKEKKYETIIELQGEVIKFAFRIHMDDYSKSEKKWIEKIIPQMGILSSKNNYGYKAKPNMPKNRAYVSLSKKFPKPYWFMELNELVDFVKKEIEIGKSLSAQLLKLLKSK